MSNKDKEQVLEIARRLEDLFEEVPSDLASDQEQNEWTSSWQSAIRELKEVAHPTQVHVVQGGDWLHLHINGERAISVHLVHSQYGNLLHTPMIQVAKLLMGDRPFVYKMPKQKKDGTYE